MGKTVADIKKEIIDKILQLCKINKSISIKKWAAIFSMETGYSEITFIKLFSILEHAEQITIREDIAMLSSLGELTLRNMQNKKNEIIGEPLQHQDIDEGLTDEEKKILGEK